MTILCAKCRAENVPQRGLPISACGECGSDLRGARKMGDSAVKDCRVGETYVVANDDVPARFLGLIDQFGQTWGQFQSLRPNDRGMKFLLGTICAAKHVDFAGPPVVAVGAALAGGEQKNTQIPIVASPETIADLSMAINTPEEENDMPEAAEAALPPTPKPTLSSIGDTINIAPWGYPIRALEDVLSGGPSAAGYHSTSDQLTCPERGRLRRLGVKRKSLIGKWKPGTPLDPALGMGTLIHELLAIRAVWGMGVIYDLLNVPGRPNWVQDWPLAESDRLKAYHLIMTYDQTHPIQADRYLGVEVSIATNLGTQDKPIIRTVRYDALVWADPMNGGQPALFSLEHKTSARGGTSSMAGYGAQFAVQVALWNANPNLVAKYGKMAGVIPDVLIKTAVPSCERMPPRYISPTQEARARTYMKYVEEIEYPVDPVDGSYPRMLHACWDRFRACEYIGLCHEDLHGDYAIDNGDADDSADATDEAA